MTLPPLLSSYLAYLTVIVNICIFTGLYVEFMVSDVSLNTYTMLYLIADLTIFSFTMSPKNDRNKHNRNNHMIFTC